VARNPGAARRFLGTFLLATVLPALATAVTVPGQPVTGPGPSPVVTWDPESVYGGVARTPTTRPMSAAEARLSRERAERLFEALTAVPAFGRPERHATSLASWAHLPTRNLLSQSFVVHWTVPRDARQRPDGAYFPIMGAATEALYLDTNKVLQPGDLATDDPWTMGRQGPDRAREAYFPEPVAHASIGGGTVYAAMLVITRDGRPLLAPAPLGRLLELDIAQLRKRVDEDERLNANALRELEASMTPEAVAARRARREAAWARETRDPAAMLRRLDAAERTDESDYARQKARLAGSEAPDPRDARWGPRLALQAMETQLAALDAAARAAPACAWRDTRFPRLLDVRWAARGPGEPADCRPMVALRDDLIGPGRPEDVRLLTAWLRDAQCGRSWSQPGTDGICSRIVATLRDLDWPAVRRALGW
jgi:hypothetical protein